MSVTSTEFTVLGATDQLEQHIFIIRSYWASLFYLLISGALLATVRHFYPELIALTISSQDPGSLQKSIAYRLKFYRYK